MHLPVVTEREFERIASEHYAMLYRFALSLTHEQAEACDLTQQTFVILAEKADQIRDPSKVRSWLFTTLRRLFLGRRRHTTRFPHHEISTVEHELPQVTPEAIDRLDAETVMEALMEVDEPYAAALVLFYFEDYSYKEIAEILGSPVGTVMSRLARGKEQIRRILSRRSSALTVKPSSEGTRQTTGTDLHGY